LANLTACFSQDRNDPKPNRAERRAQLEADLVCSCGELNSPAKPHAIKLDDHSERWATCDTCGAVGSIVLFQRTKEK